MSAILRHARYHLRTLARTPGFAVTAVLTLALGIGATTALFTVVNAVLLQPLPFPDSTRLVRIWRSELPNLTFGAASLARFADWRSRQQAFTDIGAWSPRGLTMTTSEGPERVNGATGTASLFRVLGAAPVLGRWFSDEEDTPGGNRVALISEGLWQRRFRGSSQVIGTDVILDGEKHTIVGVVPASYGEVFRFDLWVPLAAAPNPAERGNNFLQPVGRLKDGYDLAAARRSMNDMAVLVRRDHPEDRYTFTLWSLHDVVTDGSVRGLWVLLGATSLLMLIACANVTNLLLARAVVQERDLAIRSSLGAGRSRLLGLVLGETLTLGALGAALGLLLAWMLLRVFVAQAPVNFPRLSAIRLDGTVLLFTTLVAIVAGVVAGLAPALHLLRPDLNGVLRAGATRGATAGRARAASRLLVVSEVALALALVTTAGLMVKSLLNLQSQDLGLTPARVLTFGVGLPPEVAKDAAAVVRFVETFEDRIRALPGVTHAGAINLLPIQQTGFNSNVSRPDQNVPPETQPIAEMRVVTPTYFDAIGMRIVAGRALDARDRTGATPVVVINEALAAVLWPKLPLSDVVGQRIRTGWDSGTRAREVAGIVANVRSRRPDSPPFSEMYAPIAQASSAAMVYVVRSDGGDPATLTAPIRAALAEIDPQLPMSAVRTFDDVVTSSTRTSSLLSWLSALFGGLAAALAILGIYSVMSYTIAQRERELAIRAAVGADRSSLLAMVLREGFLMSAAGIAAGAVIALAASSVLRSLLYGVSATDPGIFVSAALGLAAVAMAGYLVPAARASRVEPVVALRSE
jgi:putative ABC transport system permease protein